jgi:hypothetical protein
MPRLGPFNERRLLQTSVATLALVPILAGAAGVIFGLGIVGIHSELPLGGDSHVRYLSGLLLAIGLGFWSTVPRIEAQGARFRFLTAIVLIGGLARFFAVVCCGTPPVAMLAALAMELGVTPALAIWRERLQRRLSGSATGGAMAAVTLPAGGDAR